MDLRTACGRGLVRMLHPDSLIYLADLLADPELPVRIGAAQSIAYHGTIHGLPMLRLKVLSGDPEVEVTAECLVAMMKISPEASLGFVAGLLRSEDPGMAESAALALGESRAEDAFEILRDWRNEAGSRGMDDVALVALAMLRSDKALEYLLELVAMEPGPTARSVIQAFSVQRHDPSVRAQVEAAAHRQDIDLKSTIDEVFYT